jgi:hypothetical protein
MEKDYNKQYEDEHVESTRAAPELLADDHTNPKETYRGDGQVKEVANVRDDLSIDSDARN